MGIEAEWERNGRLQPYSFRKVMITVAVEEKVPSITWFGERYGIRV